MPNEENNWSLIINKNSYGENRMKRITAFLLSMVIVLSSLLNLSGCAKEDSYVSRAEWIQLLGEQLGLNEYVSKADYYTDVKEDSEYYCYVQSCADWGIISNSESKKFKPNSTATMDFAIETAVLAAGVELEDKSYVDYAIENGIIEDNSYYNVRGKLTKKKALELLNWATNLYLSAETEEVEHVVIKDSVKNLTQNTSEITSVDGKQFVLAADMTEDVLVGDIVIFPADELNPFGVARKIISVGTDEMGNLRVETEEPAIEEICDELEINTTVVPDIEDVILADGVTFNSGVTPLATTDTEYQIDSLVNKHSTHKAMDVSNDMNGLDFSVDVNFTKGTIEVSKAWDSLLGIGENFKVGGEGAYSIKSGLNPDAGEWFNKKSIIPDRTLFGSDPYDNTEAIEDYKAGNITLDELKNKLNLSADQHETEVASMTNEFSGGYQVTGSLNINNLYIKPELELKKNWLGFPTGIKRYAMTVDYDIDASLTLAGELKDELTVCTIPVPIAATGVSVNVEIIVFAELNGELTVKAQIANTTKTEWEDGLSKKTANSSSSLSAEVGAQLDVGPGLNVSVKILGVDIVDAELTCAIRFKADTSITYQTRYVDSGGDTITINRESKWQYGVNGYIPIVKISIGTPGTLANKVGLSMSWELIGEKKAYKIPICNDEIVIWSEEQIIQKVDEEEETEEFTEENQENDDFGEMGEYLSINTYYLDLAPSDQADITVTNIPEGYSEEDIIWESDNVEVVSVSSGKLTANGVGSATIIVRTTDDMYEAHCSVSVQEEEVEFTPLKEVDF